MSDAAFPDALPVGYRLHWYMLEHVLGQGGFGITYLAHDTNLDRRVAIKEYLPTDFARRRSDATVCPRAESHAERYAWGLERFLSEARTLARFDHPNIVRVASVFEANNTAYMVMRFEEGEDLATLLERCGTLPERQVLGCLLPILEGLELVHEAGFIHRDIKPENIYVRRDGSAVLLDFGSARQSFGRSKTMTILVAPGYAPLEQYYGDAATQGPWTDIYGLGATCYRAIAGRAPLDAIARAKGVLGSAHEILQPATELGRGRYSERLLAAVDRALQLTERDRPQSVAEWRRDIVAPAVQAQVATDNTVPALPDRKAPIVTLQPSPTLPHGAFPDPERRETDRSRRGPLLWGAVAAVGALAAVSALVMPARRVAPAATPQPQAVLAPPPAVALAVAPEPPRAQETPPQSTALPKDVQVSVSKVATIVSPPADKVSSHEPRGRARSTAPLASTPAPARAPAPSPEPGPPTPAVPAPTAALAPAASPPSAEAAALATQAVPSDNSALRRARDEKLDAAEAALRRGDHATAAEMLAPWAAAGVPRAQALLGRTQEGRSGRQQNDFEAYVWYGVAARAGEPGAQTMKDKVAAKLQPAEIRQAEQLIERWKPRTGPP